MGIPYFKVRQGTRPRSWGLWGSSHLALGLGNEAKRERIRGNGISLTLVTNGWKMGWCGCQPQWVDVSPARQVESPVLELISVSQQGPRGGTTGGGLVREAHPVGWISEFLHHNVRQVKIKESELGSQVRKGNFIRGKRESDWPLRRTSILPFWWSPSYIPPMKNPLKGWSHSWRSEIWWPCSFEKIGASEITRCHLGNLVSLTDHCDFILCLQGRHNKPFYQWDPMWTLSVPVSSNLLQNLLFVDLLFVCLLCFPFVVWWFPFVLCFCSLTFGFCESVLCFSCSMSLGETIIYYGLGGLYLLGSSMCIMGGFK